MSKYPGNWAVNKYPWRFPRYNRLYGAGVGYTTRRFPGRYRTPSTVTGGRRFRRLGRRGLQNFVLGLNERKYIDNVIVATSTSTPSAPGCVWSSPQIKQMFTIVPGNAVNQRIGDKVVLRNIAIKGRIYYDWGDRTFQTSYANSCRVRILVFIWKDDTVPTSTEVVDNSAGFLTSDACSFFLDHDRKVKRKLLWDKTYDVCNDCFTFTTGWLAAPGPDSAFDVAKYIDMSRLPLSLRTVNYQAGTDNAVNKVYCLMVADANDAGSSQMGPQLRLNVRTIFTDA